MFNKTTDVTLPWVIALKLFKPQLLMALMRRNNPQGVAYTLESATATYEAALTNYSVELHALMNELANSEEQTLLVPKVPESPVTGAERCSYYRCWERKGPSGYCKYHDNEYCSADMTRYRDLLKDGHSVTSAALQAGLTDPPDPSAE